ncbi:hypothetical protein ACFC0S_17125 [Streptomyces sp. NPDC056084]|uniref:hypothetical protein n=1 Tax=unclassified Streptomyces TaxID=2593676 RepID=UPI0035E36D95
MTAEATKAPTKAQQAAARRRIEDLKKQAIAELEAQLKRWTPEEVVEKQLLPYRSVRSLKEKCYRREVHCHLDGNGITFTADDIRAENARTAVPPIAA